MSDKRQYPRFELAAPAKFKIPTQKMDISMASIKNISGGGLCLVASNKINLGQIIQVEFVLPLDKSNIIAKCEVVWVDKFAEPEGHYKYELGVKFVEIDKQQQKNINRFVVQRLKTRVREELGFIGVAHGRDIVAGQGHDGLLQSHQGRAALAIERPESCVSPSRTVDHGENSSPCEHGSKRYYSRAARVRRNFVSGSSSPKGLRHKSG